MKYRLPSLLFFLANFGTRVKYFIPGMMEGREISSEYHLPNCIDKHNCKCAEQHTPKRSCKKLKLYPEGRFDLQKVCNEKYYERKVGPNYFVAVQVSNPKIHDAVQNIQNHISNQDARLDRTMIDCSTLHLTLMVMHIGGKETYIKAMKALTNVHAELNDIFCKQPLKLEFHGLDHFRNKVIYAKIQENESYERFCSLNECVKKHFAEEEILSTDTRTKFNPHLTIAKIDYGCKKPRAIGKIDPLLYEKFTDHYIGSETIQSIQLLSMTEPKDEAGYYTGVKLFFSLPEVC